MQVIVDRSSSAVQKLTISNARLALSREPLSALPAGAHGTQAYFPKKSGMFWQ
jgi:hypothetical protein